jgi:hypothetical protein
MDLLLLSPRSYWGGKRTHFFFALSASFLLAPFGFAFFLSQAFKVDTVVEGVILLLCRSILAFSYVERKGEHHDDDGAGATKFLQFTLWVSAWLTLLKSLEGIQHYLSLPVTRKNLCVEKQVPVWDRHCRAFLVVWQKCQQKIWAIFGVKGSCAVTLK